MRTRRSGGHFRITDNLHLPISKAAPKPPCPASSRERERHVSIPLPEDSCCLGLTLRAPREMKLGVGGRHFRVPARAWVHSASWLRSQASCPRKHAVTGHQSCISEISISSTTDSQQKVEAVLDADEATGHSETPPGEDSHTIVTSTTDEPISSMKPIACTRTNQPLTTAALRRQRRCLG